MENANFQRGVGCEACHQTGFSGRTALAELLTMETEFREAVLERQTTSALQTLAVKLGMQSLWERGIRRALSGQTPLEEILRVVTMDRI